MYRVYGDTMCLLCGVGRGSNFITPGSSNNSIIVGPTKSISAVKYRVTGPTLIFYYLLLSFLLLSHYFDIMNVSCQHMTYQGLPLVSIGTNIALKSSVVVKKIIARNVKNR